MEYTTLSSHRTYESAIRAFLDHASHRIPATRLRIVGDDLAVVPRPVSPKPFMGGVVAAGLVGADLGFLVGILAALMDPATNAEGMLDLGLLGLALGGIAGVGAGIVRGALAPRELATSLVLTGRSFCVEAALDPAPEWASTLGAPSVSGESATRNT